MGSCFTPENTNKNSRGFPYKLDKDRSTEIIRIYREEKNQRNGFTKFSMYNGNSKKNIEVNELIALSWDQIIEMKEIVILVSSILPSKSQEGFVNKPITVTSEGYFDKEEVKEEFAKIAYECRKGIKDYENQDDIFILITKSFKLFCVTDGHGQFGHDCSDFVKQILPKLIVLNSNFQSNVELALKDSFREIDNFLSIKCEFEGGFSNKASGTTATVVVIKDNYLFSANVGDSRAILYCSEENNNYSIIPLTKDHHPDDQIERERILSYGGEIKRKNEFSPFRIYNKGHSYPGLAMTRVIGDITSRNVGIISAPDIFSKQIETKDKILFICTDGVWEFLTNDEAAKIVIENQNNIKVAARNLCEKAYFKWKKNGISTDDITCLLYFLS